MANFSFCNFLKTHLGAKFIFPKIALLVKIVNLTLKIDNFKQIKRFYNCNFFIFAFFTNINFALYPISELVTLLKNTLYIKVWNAIIMIRIGGKGGHTALCIGTV